MILRDGEVRSRWHSWAPSRGTARPGVPPDPCQLQRVAARCRPHAQPVQRSSRAAIRSTGPLSLVDLRGDGPIRIAAPTAVAHDANHAAGRSLSAATGRGGAGGVL